MSQSEYVDTLVLKGALLLRVIGISEIRSTRDIDFLGVEDRGIEQMKSVIADCCNVPVEEDGLEFDLNNIEADEISENQAYEGYRFKVKGSLGTLINSKKRLEDKSRSERERFERLISTLHEEMKRLEHKPTSAWIFGKVAKGMDEYGDPLQIAVLGELKTIESQTDKLKDRIYQSGIEAEFDVTIDLRGVTVADLEFRSELTEGPIILLWGIEPKQFLKASSETSNGNHTHYDLDVRSLADAKAWTQLLKRYPEIVSRIINYFDERIPQIRIGEKKELQKLFLITFHI